VPIIQLQSWQQCMQTVRVDLGLLCDTGTTTIGRWCRPTWHASRPNAALAAGQPVGSLLCNSGSTPVTTAVALAQHRRGSGWSHMGKARCGKTHAGEQRQAGKTPNRPIMEKQAGSRAAPASTGRLCGSRRAAASTPAGPARTKGACFVEQQLHSALRLCLGSRTVEGAYQGTCCARPN
jgi:hypothetical protein